MRRRANGRELEKKECFTPIYYAVFPSRNSVTADLKSRLAKHNAGEVPHTSKYKQWKIEAYFAFATKEKAAAFEAYLKTGSGHAFTKRHF